MNFMPSERERELEKDRISLAAVLKSRALTNSVSDGRGSVHAVHFPSGHSIGNATHWTFVTPTVHTARPQPLPDAVNVLRDLLRIASKLAQGMRTQVRATHSPCCHFTQDTLQQPKFNVEIDLKVLTPDETEYVCTFPACKAQQLQLQQSFLNSEPFVRQLHFQKKVDFARHLMLHYPSGSFCPVCEQTFARPDALKRHFKSSRCDYTLDGRQKARHFGIMQIVTSTGKVDAKRVCAIDYFKYFNMYYLGALDEFADRVRMSYTDFEVLARRDCDDAMTLPYMKRGNPATNMILVEMRAAAEANSTRNG